MRINTFTATNGHDEILHGAAVPKLWRAISIRVAKQPRDVTIMQKLGAPAMPRVWSAVTQLSTAICSTVVISSNTTRCTAWFSCLVYIHATGARNAIQDVMWCDLKKLQWDQRINTLGTIKICWFWSNMTLTTRRIKCTDSVIGKTVLKINTYLVTTLHDGFGVCRRARISEKNDY